MRCFLALSIWRTALKKTLGLTFLLIGLVTASAQAQWRYTALGDSLAAGFNAVAGYVIRYDVYVTSDTGKTVLLYNLGQPGWKSSDLREALTSDSTFRYLVSHSRVITWNIGGNDLLSARRRYKDLVCGGVDNQDCLRSTVVVFKENWDQIVSKLLELRRESPGDIRRTLIRTMDIYNPFVAVDSAADSWPNDAGNDFQVLKPYLDEVNSHIAQSSVANAIPFAPVYLAFNGTDGTEDPRQKGYISIDGLHPNDFGHKVMADLLRSLGYAPLYP
jgi:lysophospholipase L1-like esterase